MIYKNGKNEIPSENINLLNYKKNRSRPEIFTYEDKTKLLENVYTER